MVIESSQSVLSIVRVKLSLGERAYVSWHKKLLEETKNNYGGTITTMSIKLSQCMIVKNEEKNIRQALSWGKDICFEQIVVDTGSTDNTVEIAKELGAKIFHFPWIEDFAAAKNYAIEQASGDWIAFLDADEYFKEEDARKIIPIIKRIKTVPPKTRPCIIGTTMLHLDDKNQILGMGKQTRLFERKNVRYEGAIHERPVCINGKEMILLKAYEELSIYHTGYSQETYKSVKKLDRNISMIEKVLEMEPNNYDYWSYLGDSLLADHQIEAAEKAYKKVVECGDENVIPNRRDAAYSNLMAIYARKGDDELQPQIETLHMSYTQLGGTCPDVDYFAGLFMYKHEKSEKALHYLERALKLLENYEVDLPMKMSGDLNDVYVMLAKLCYALQKKSDCVRYAVLALRMNAYLDGVLSVVLRLLQEEKGEAENPAATYTFLSKLYNMDSVKDLLFIYKCAKIAHFHKLADIIFNVLPKDVQTQLSLN